MVSARFSALLALLLVTSCVKASDPIPMWGDWDLGVYPGSCILMKRYEIPSGRDSESRGFLTGSPYNQVHIRIYVRTPDRDTLTPDELVGIPFLAVQISASGDVPAENQVTSVSLGGYSVHSQKHNHGDWMADFWFSEEDTLAVMELFDDNEVDALVFTLANGEKIEGKIYPFYSRNFPVWRAVLETCARENAI